MSNDYICFCCGKHFKEYTEFQYHILSEHEEGRDYVLCPLKRCRAPVRDVRCHMKAKHPQEPLPLHGQMKALVWRDAKNQKVEKKKIYKEGYFNSVKNNGKAMHYRSGYELQVYECLERMADVINYDVEPFPVKYLFNGSEKNYWPDIRVNYADGHVEIWEIKPKNQSALPVNQAKWEACNQYCENRGWVFQILTERGINCLLKISQNRMKSTQ